MEWYMKANRIKQGYYDSYKKTSKNKEEKEIIINSKNMLNQFWTKFVQYKHLMPQEDIRFHNRWLYSETNYRRIVEPLDIVDHYQKETQTILSLVQNTIS